jgi:hypothetical protein
MDYATLIATVILPLIKYGVEAAKAYEAGKVDDAKAFMRAGIAEASAKVDAMLGALSKPDADAMAELDARFPDPLKAIKDAVHARADEILAAVTAQPVSLKVEVTGTDPDHLHLPSLAAPVAPQE